MVDLKVVCCILAVLALWQDPVTSQPPSLFPYGSGSGDLNFDEDDAFTPGTQLSVPYILYGTEHTTIYVNDNGAISFESSSILLCCNRYFPHSLSLIVAFWNDVDTNVGGSIWYRQSSSVSDLTRAHDFLRDVAVRFYPAQVFVATWDGVSKFQGSSSTSNVFLVPTQTNTFQAVLMTDGTRSYTAFLYEQIEWGTLVTAGFNDNITGEYYSWPNGANAEQSDQQILYGTDLLTATNVDMPGVLVFRTDGPEIEGIENDFPTSELVPYGSVGVSYSADDDAHGFVGPLELHPPFLFLGVEQEQLYINENGIISFGAPYTVCCPQDFPLSEATPPLIIPFWADILNGSIYYHEESNSSVFDEVIFLLEYISEPFQFIDELSFLSVITWDFSVTSTSNSSSNGTTEVNSFQALLTSDDTQSYVIFKYAGGSQGSGDDAQIGFNDGSDPSVFYMLPGGGSLLELASGSNTFPEVPGVYVFTVQHGGPPQEFTVASLSSTSLTCLWLPPQGGVLTGYELSCLPLATAFPQPLPLVLSEAVQNATFMELYRGVAYNCSVIAVSDTAIRRRSIPAIQFATTLSISPSGPPLGFLSNNPGPRSVEFDWTAPDILLRNGVITGYTLACAPLDGSQGDIVVMRFASEFEGPAVLEGLSPDSSYECSVFASNSAGDGLNSSLTVRTSEEAIFFQLRMKGLFDCLQWVHASDSPEKLADIISEIVEEAEAICRCGLTETLISDAAFYCFSDSAQEVTFRAKFQGTSQTSAMDAAAFVAEWIQNPDSVVIIQGVRLTIDTLCPVLITSFAEEECTVPPPTVLSSASASVTAIVAGVVGVFILLVICGIVVIAVCFVARGRCTNGQPSEPVNINSQILRQASTKSCRDDGAYELDGLSGKAGFSPIYDTVMKPNEDHEYASVPYTLPQITASSPGRGGEATPRVAFSLPRYTDPPNRQDIETEIYDDATCKRANSLAAGSSSNSVYELDDGQSKTAQCVSQSPYELDAEEIKAEDLVTENARQSAYDQTQSELAGIETTECEAYGSYNRKTTWADDPSYDFLSFSKFESSRTDGIKPPTDLCEEPSAASPQTELKEETLCEQATPTQGTTKVVMLNEEPATNMDPKLGGVNTSAGEESSSSVVEDAILEGGVPPVHT